MSWPVHRAASVFPMLSDEELRELADDIARHGLLEPLWLYDDPDEGRVLLDGRNRLRACELADVEPTTRLYTGTDPIGFVVSENVRRRHLSAGQLGLLALDLEQLYAESNRPGRPRKDEIVADLPHLSTDERKARERAAKVVGTSGRVVSQAKRVANKAPDLAEKVKAGALAIDRADRIVRDREAEQRRIEQAREDAKVVSIAVRAEVRGGDFREVLADLTGVAAIITDPPYPAEFLPLYADLAAWADKVLAPDGVLAVLSGQTHLPEVYRQLDGYRPYRWTACYLTTGAGYVSHPRRVQSQWKPVLIYGGGPRLADVIRSEGANANAKDLHHWGQDYGAFHTLVQRLTRPGQLVVDPFAGSSTTLLAAKALHRHAIGAEIDPEHLGVARRRIDAGA
jgi:ParB-like chromosome segregation protein Spo0J